MPDLYPPPPRDPQTTITALTPRNSTPCNAPAGGRRRRLAARALALGRGCPRDMSLHRRQSPICVCVHDGSPRARGVEQNCVPLSCCVLGIFPIRTQRRLLGCCRRHPSIVCWDDSGHGGPRAVVCKCIAYVLSLVFVTLGAQGNGNSAEVNKHRPDPV